MGIMKAALPAAIVSLAARPALAQRAMDLQEASYYFAYTWGFFLASIIIPTVLYKKLSKNSDWTTALGFGMCAMLFLTFAGFFEAIGVDYKQWGRG